MTESATQPADPIANFRLHTAIAAGLAPLMQIRTDTAKAVLAEIDRLTEQNAARLRLLEQAASDGEAAVQQRDRLYETLREVLSGHWQRGHPGYEAMRTFWIYAATVQKWQAVLAETPRPTPVEDSAELQTPDAWSEHYGLEVRDPDGWRTPDAPSWDTPITLAEFRRRFASSTVRPLGREGLGQIHDRIVADLRAADRAQHE